MSLYYGTCSYVHEVILHVDAENSIMDDPVNEQSKQSTWRSSTVRMDLLFGCMETTKTFLDYFLSLPQSEIEVGTIMDFSRLTYNMLVLGKLSLGPGLGFDDDAIKRSANLRYYFTLFDKHMDDILASQGGIPQRNVYFHFKRIFNNTKSWFECQLQRRSTSPDNSSARGDSKNLNLLQILDDSNPHAQDDYTMDDMDLDLTLTSQDSFWDEMMAGWPASFEIPGL